jgi:hypothetical protein
MLVQSLASSLSNFPDIALVGLALADHQLVYPRQRRAQQLDLAAWAILFVGD